MSSSISLSWSHCHVVARNGGWSRLVNLSTGQKTESLAKVAVIGGAGIENKVSKMVKSQAKQR